MKVYWNERYLTNSFLLLMICLFTCLHKCLTLDMIFVRIYTDKFISAYFKESSEDASISCARVCTREMFCVGFGYNKISCRCVLYEYDITASASTVEMHTDLWIDGHVKGCLQFRPGESVSFSCNDTEVNQTVTTTGRCLRTGSWLIPLDTCVYQVSTCSQAYQRGVQMSTNTTTYILIKPSSTSDIMSVACVVESDGIYTVIGHNLQDRTYLVGHEARRSYAIPITYNIPLQQAIHIADASAECEQYMKFECHHSVASYNGFTLRNGDTANYFIGGVKGQNDCACHINNTCALEKKCNCDANDFILREDEGHNRYKEDLPITAFLTGDTGHRLEYGYITIGSLACKG